VLELDTYRQSGHFEGDQMRYRTKEEAVAWAERDPLLAAATRLDDDDATATIRAAAEAEMAEAIEWADAQPAADPGSLFDDVYAEAVG